MLVQAIGVAFNNSTAALAITLGGRGLLPAELGLLSTAALAPAAAGTVAGQWLRRRISEAQFRKAFFAALLVLGAYIAAKPFL